LTTSPTASELVPRIGTRPKVTVWIPSYNHAPYLPAAIDSVLAQSFDDLELLVVDDGSTDGSLAIAERYAASHPERISVLTHPGHANRGVSASANLAISRSSGGFLAGLASDDVLYADTVERQVGFLERNPAVGCVYGYAHMVDESGRRIPNARTFGIDLTRGGGTLERLVQGNAIPSMTAMFRRHCLELSGPFDDTVVYSDWELFVRIAAHCEIGFLPRALAMYRVHHTNASLNVTLETNLDRALEVTTLLRDSAARIGGRLTDPRVRATLDLQLGFLRFARGDERGGAGDVRAAFARDPSLATDGRWLGDWLWSRLLQELLPPGRPDFPSWLASQCAATLSPEARRGFRRDVAAARHVAQALQLARRGRSLAAHREALAAVALSPRHATDRRLGAVLLDSVGDGLAAKGVRAAKRQLLRHR
jgi:glycosyltransferase involved in cell wall biosynthesis